MRSNSKAITPISDDDYIVASVTPASTAALTLLQTSWATPHRISATFGGDSAKTLTIVGTDTRGLALTEVITSTGAGIISTVRHFASITSITPSAAFASTVKVGLLGLACSTWTPHNHRARNFLLSLWGKLSTGAVMTWSIQHTLDDVQDKTVTLTTLTHDTLAAQTASDDGNYVLPISASRMIITSYTSGTAEYITQQAG